MTRASARVFLFENSMGYTIGMEKPPESSELRQQLDLYLHAVRSDMELFAQVYEYGDTWRTQLELALANAEELALDVTPEEAVRHNQTWHALIGSTMPADAPVNERAVDGFIERTLLALLVEQFGEL